MRASYFLLLLSITKYRVRIFLFVGISYVCLPIFVTTLYQETFAKGVSAISYDGNGVCSFEHVEANEKDDVLNGTCSLILHNRSKDAVTVELSFVDDLVHKEDVRFESLMNDAGPYTFTLEGNTKETIRLNELLDVAGIKNRIDSGTSHNVHIQVSDGKKERIL